MHPIAVGEKKRMAESPLVLLHRHSANPQPTEFQVCHDNAYFFSDAVMTDSPRLSGAQFASVPMLVLMPIAIRISQHGGIFTELEALWTLISIDWI